ncbi:MAG: DUF4393 domain-containing protein [Eubacteriales bacterium]|nr:DUF4393 domain-containing protein [Eubacteriales bacterium]
MELIEINPIIPDETKHQFYKDAIHPSAKELGKTLSLVPRLVNTIISPLEKYIYTKECNIQYTKDLIAEKIKNQNPESLVAPEPYVAVPALNAISYSMDNDQLRDMYANLLAKSMIKGTRSLVHPSFVECIKQMSPLDAKLFHHLAHTEFTGLIDLIAVEEYDKELGMYSSYEILETNISGLDLSDHQLQSASFNLLERLAFIKISQDVLADKYCYSRILLSREYKHLAKLHSHLRTENQEKLFNITDFGKLFIKICLDDAIPE